MDKGPLSEILSERKNIISIIILTILASLGVNLISDSVVRLFFVKPYILFIIALATVLTSMGGYSLVIMKGKIIQERKYSGFFIVDEIDKKAIPVRRYSYSEDLSRYLGAVFAESPEIKKLAFPTVIFHIDVCTSVSDKTKEASKQAYTYNNNSNNEG